MPHLTTFTELQPLTLLDAVWAKNLRDRAQIRKASGTVDAWADFAGKGGLHRVGVIVNTTRPSSASYNTYVLDGEADWRDRLVFFTVNGSRAMGYLGGHHPGGAEDALPPAARGLHFTHAGIAEGQGVSGRHFRVDNGGTAGAVRIYARDTDGALMIERSISHDSADPLTYIVHVIATEKLGERHTNPAPVPAQVAVDGNNIVANDLNTLQDLAMLGQFRGSDIPSGSPAVSMPLGPIVRGNRGLPVLWTRKVKLPDGDGGGVVSKEYRQPIFGAVRRVFAVSIAATTSVDLDTSVDWRARFLWGRGRVSVAASPTDFRPGEASETSHNSATEWVQASAFLGSGASGHGVESSFAHRLYITDGITSTAVSLFADSTTGALKLANGKSNPAIVTGMIEASFPLTDSEL